MKRIGPLIAVLFLIQACNLPVAATDNLTGPPVVVNTSEPTPTGPSPTATFTVDATPSDTPPPASPTPEGLYFTQVRTDLARFYYGPGCTPSQVRFDVTVSDPSRVANVVLFLRLKNQITSERTDWNDGIAMNPEGDGHYSYILLAKWVPDYTRFLKSWLMYQLVATKKGEIVIRSDVYTSSLELYSCP